MRAKISFVLMAAMLTACGSSNSDGSVATGPLGQKPLMTQEVQVATSRGISACSAALDGRAPLSALQRHGFTPWRGGYRAYIDNPLLFTGSSSVSAKLDRDACRVSTGPVFAIELQTVMSITRKTLGESGRGKDVLFRQKADRIEIILR